MKDARAQNLDADLPVTQTQCRLRLPVDKQVFFLSACFAIGMLLFFRAQVHGSDPVGYYSWLRSAVIENTLNVRDTWEHYRNEAIAQGDEFYATTATGYQYNHWSAGPALLWLPFYLIAHAGVLIANMIGIRIPADGYSLPYVASASLASAFYVFVGMLLLYQIGQRFVSANVAAACAAVIWFGTPIVFYAYSNPLMSHAADAFINIAFIFAWLKTRDRPIAGNRLLQGAVIGLATWIRPQNAVLLLVPAVETLFERCDQAANATIRARLWHWLKRAIPLGVGYALLFLPQMAFWKIVYGGWIVNTYQATQGDLLQLARPRLLYVLFSSDRGLFTWTPLFIPSIAGMAPLFKFDRRLTILLLINFCIATYLTASLIFGPGTSFGSRYFLNQIGFFGLGLMAFAAWVRPRISPYLLGGLGGALILWNLLLMAQYALEIVPRTGPVDLDQMVVNQFRVIGLVVKRLNDLIGARF